jgi:hypothetical protein
VKWLAPTPTPAWEKVAALFLRPVFQILCSKLEGAPDPDGH